MVADYATTAELLDGTSVLVRGLRPDDYDAVIRMVGELTPEERYHRFFTAYPAYVGEWALSLTSPADSTDSVVALGAFDCDELVGVANYTTLAQAGDAEIAIVVAHQQHQRGIGTVLLRTLGRIAHAAGVHRFVADILTENNSMRAVIRDAGWPVVAHCDREVMSLELNLDDLDQRLREDRPV